MHQSVTDTLVVFSLLFPVQPLGFCSLRDAMTVVWWMCSDHWYSSALLNAGLLTVSPVHYSNITRQHVITVSIGVCFSSKYHLHQGRI